MVLIKVRKAPVPVLLLVSLARLLLFMGSLKQASKLVWPTVLTKKGGAGSGFVFASRFSFESPSFVGGFEAGFGAGLAARFW